MNEIHPILQFMHQYGYWIAVPIMIIEGPIITIAMGFLSSLGYFTLPVVIGLSVLSDLISDSIYYWSGYRGGPAVMNKLKIPQLHENNSLQKLKDRFEKHPGKVFFGAKVLTGLAHSTFVLAGVTKVDYKKILRYSIPGGLVWSTGLGLLGFYFGRYATSIGRFLSMLGLIVFIVLIVFLFYKVWLGEFLSKKLAVWRQNGNQD